jgi:hypothetical protein
MLVKKITTGFVVQTFDTITEKWVSQEFVAGDECDYENDKGDYAVIDQYLPFNMIQP